jgi:glycerophosphoryl diester phosphodiesterase
MSLVRASDRSSRVDAVQVVAHRGSSDDAPEHTLHAYKRAIDDGADALECDVRLTKDGHLVCVHDRRIDRTSNGRGILSTLELAELTELDWGSWRDTWEDFEDPEMPDRDKSQILTLRRLLEAVATVDRRVEVAIETKHPTRYAGLVERRLVALLDEFGWAGAGSPVRVMSFSQLSLRRLRSLAPDLRTVMLFERVPLRFRDGSLPEGVAAAGPSIEIVRAHPRYVERAHRQGHPVHVWTVDTADDVELCLDLGVEAIITNRPGRVLRALGRAPGERPAE